MSSNNRIGVDVHYPRLDVVRELYPAALYPDQPDEKRAVTVRLGEVTIFFANATAAHDFATELHSRIERDIWGGR